MILWEPSTTAVFEKDPFSKPLLDVDEAIAGDMFYVIDGQQRLTSLLLLFKDWRITRGGEEIKLDIPISYSPTTKKFLKSKTRGRDLSTLVKAFWLKDTDTLSALIEETPKDIFEEMKEKVDRILRYKVPVYVMKTYQEDEETFLDMAEAFIRVNRYGVRIGNLELMLSFLAGAISGELKEKVYELYESSYEGFETELQPIIRFAFSNFGLKQTQISRVNQFKANVRRISDFTDAQISAIFDRSKTAMNVTVELLRQELGISNSRLLPSQVPLVTVASYFYQKNADELHDLDEQDLGKILDWFILASFNGYYSSATDTKLDEDLSVVRASRRFPYEELMENMKKRKAKVNITESDIKRGLMINALRREGRAHLFILYILLVKRQADNWNGKLLSQSPLVELARHHIFPKGFLEENLEVDDPHDREIAMNNLANISFIQKGINSEIGDESPESYMSRYVRSAKKHFVPIDETLWRMDQYPTFLEYRAIEIYRAGRNMFTEIFE